jgi:hypothetical protein
VNVGEQLQLLFYFEDTRSTPLGAFAAFADIGFESSLAAQVSPSAFTPGLISGAGTAEFFRCRPRPRRPIRW